MYAQGSDALQSVIKTVLNGIPLGSASGLGTWASDEFERRVKDFGFAPPDLQARKAVLVNSVHVLEADTSTFSARLLSTKNGAASAAESLASGVVEGLSTDFELATIVLVEGVVEIPITIALPSFVTEGLAGAFRSGIDQLYSVVSSWTGARQWR